MSFELSITATLAGSVNYSREIESYWKQKESQRQQYRFTSPQISFRADLVEWVKDVSEKFTLSIRTTHLAVYILDMFMDRHDIEKDRLSFVALVCLMLAAKFDELDYKIPRISEMMKHDGFRYSNSDFIRVEVMILSFLNFGLTQPTIAHFAEYYVLFTLTFHDLRTHKESQQYLESLANSSVTELLNICLKEINFLRYPPSQVAAACVLATRIRMKLHPAWTSTLAQTTGYQEDPLIPCVNLMLGKKHEGFSRRRGVFVSPDSGYLSDMS